MVKNFKMGYTNAFVKLTMKIHSDNGRQHILYLCCNQRGRNFYYSFSSIKKYEFDWLLIKKLQHSKHL